MKALGMACVVLLATMTVPRADDVVRGAGTPAIAAPATSTVVTSAPAAKTVKLGKLVVPRAPPKPGCYQHLKGGAGWQEIPCLSQDQLAKMPHPDNAAYLQEQLPPAPQVLVPKAYVEFDILQFGGVTDNKFGNGRYSSVKLEYV
jgi:hypothetical protein